MNPNLPSSSSDGTGVAWLLNHLGRRVWPLSAITVFVAVSMAYSFWWGPVIHHQPGWVVPGDIWSTFRAAHWVGWGSLGSVYGSDTQLVTFPGIAVLLAPVAMISGALGLSESIAPVFLAHPTSWYLLGPAILLLGSSCLLSFDAAAEEMGVDRPRRALLCLVEAVVIFQVLTIWGHPEDMVALALALYALLAMVRRLWTLSAWLWGVAIVVQPLVLLLLPLAFVRTPADRRVRLCVIAALPSAVLVGTPMLTDWGATSKVLFQQANFEYLDHATPWVALSPRLSDVSVGAGPGRLIAVAASVGLAVLASRRRPSVAGLIWLSAVALSLRCFFEAVMVSFYLGPPLAMIVLAAALRRSWSRLVGAGLIAVAATVVAFRRMPPWGYWGSVVALLVVGLLVAWPGRGALGWWDRRASDSGAGAAPVPRSGDRVDGSKPPIRVGALQDGHGLDPVPLDVAR